MTTPKKDTTAAAATPVQLKKLLWVRQVMVKQKGGDELRKLEHNCYQTCPAVEFKPYNADPDDPRPHAMVSEQFGNFLVEEAIEPNTGEPHYVWADDPAAPNQRQYAALTNAPKRAAFGAQA